MLQGLDPVLEGIVADLEKVTDYSNLIKLKKDLADQKAIDKKHEKKVLENEEKDSASESDSEDDEEKSAVKK